MFLKHLKTQTIIPDTAVISRLASASIPAPRATHGLIFNAAPECDDCGTQNPAHGVREMGRDAFGPLHYCRRCEPLETVQQFFAED